MFLRLQIKNLITQKHNTHMIYHASQTCMYPFIHKMSKTGYFIIYVAYIKKKKKWNNHIMCYHTWNALVKKERHFIQYTSVTFLCNLWAWLTFNRLMDIISPRTLNHRNVWSKPHPFLWMKEQTVYRHIYMDCFSRDPLCSSEITWKSQLISLVSYLSSWS